MKRLSFFLFTAILFTYNSINAQQLKFQKTIGGAGDDVAYGVEQTMDGGYILAGYTKSYGPGNFENAYLVKTDSNGNVSWTKTYGKTNGSSKFRSVKQTIDGGFIAAGYLFVSGSGTSFDMLVVKTDANGIAQWTKTYGGNGVDSASSIAKTNDGGYIVSGYTTPGFSGLDTPRTSLIKLNSAGNIIWSHSYLYVEADNVFQTFDGGYAVKCGGYINNSVLLAKTDGNGILQSFKGYQGGPQSNGTSFLGTRQTLDMGYIMTTRGSGNFGGSDMELVKIDSAGNVFWAKVYGAQGNDDGYSVQQTKDKGYALMGSSYSFGFGDADIYFIKTDSVGNLQWGNDIGVAGTDDIGYAMEQTKDGGYIIAGTTKSFSNSYDIYLIKTDSFGHSGCYEKNPVVNYTNVFAGPTNYSFPMLTGNIASAVTLNYSSGGDDSTLCTNSTGIEDVFSMKASMEIYPNPAYNYVSVKLHGIKDNEKMTIILTDFTGRVVANLYNGNAAQLAGNNKLALHDIAAGLYLVQVRNSTKTLPVQKLVVE